MQFIAATIVNQIENKTYKRMALVILGFIIPKLSTNITS